MQLHLLTTLTTFLLTTTITCAPNPEPNPDADPILLEARSCVADGCTALKGTPQGQYCGYCYQVGGNWHAADIYELNPKGGCCNYGTSKKYKAGYAQSPYNYDYCDGKV